jgi:hypothetical protein
LWQKNNFFTLGALVHLRHFKLGCSFAALCIYLSFGHGLNGNGWQRKAGKKTKLQIPESSFYQTPLIRKG